MKDYKKYRWFYTSHGSLVVGGKNAEQNDELLKIVLEMKKDLWVMHTSAPGSPFSVIFKDKNNVTKNELDECAIFTGCFSRAWKEGRKSAEIDVFSSAQLSKERGMKAGMWRVLGKVDKQKVEMKLSLVKQKGVLRAVPLSSVKKSQVIASVCPGKNDKSVVAHAFEVDMGEKIGYDELMAALPAGGVRKCK